MELLEDRRVFAAIPSVTLTAPATSMIGESLQLTATFDNLSPTDTGFGPFIDLYLPFNGADGVNGVDPDGLTFVSATYLGLPLGTSVLTFPDFGGGTGTVEHPFAVDSAGNPLLVSGNAGDQLVVIIQPFGSFAPDQPPAEVLISLDLSNFADLGVPLDLYARAGFRFGNDPLDNPDVDPSLVSQPSTVAMDWLPTASIEPILMELTKNYLGPEDETATGPNFPRQYEIIVDIADGQTITDLDITDFLPPNIVVTGVDTISPAGTVTTPLTFPLPPANPPGNELVVNIPTVTGTTSATDARVVFSFYVPFRDADGNPVINPGSGDDTISNNNVTAVGDWTPLDPRDPAGTDNAVADPAGFEHVLIPKSIAIQKSVEPLLAPGSDTFVPGSVVEYTIVGQISDFFGFDDLVMTDILSDGLRFDTSFTPLLTWTGHLGSSAAGINSANYELIDRFTGGSPPVAPINGTQEVVFRISDELEDRGRPRIGVGGLVPSGGTGGLDPDESTFDGGPTTFTITFRAIVQQIFTDDFAPGEPAVDEGDILNNRVEIVGDVLNYVDLLPTGETESDDSNAEFEIVRGTFDKSIYAINGSTTFDPNFLITPGDTVTYRIRHTSPLTRFESLQLTDYLPVPVLLATEVVAFDATPASATPPIAGRAKYGPDDTFLSDHALVPTLTTDAVSNSVLFSYGLHTDPIGTPSVLDLLFTVTVQPIPFADELFLTNQVRLIQDTTNAGISIEDSLVQIRTGQPELNIKKGVVATDNANGIFSPTIVGPVPFNDPGTVGSRFTGTISSDGLLAAPIDSNLSNVDAGDLVTFAIVIENTGSSRRGAFDIIVRDTLPAGFVIPSGGAGLNLRVTDGTGGLVTYVDIDGGLFDEVGPGGIQLDDPGPTIEQPDGTAGGVADAYDPTSGRNVIIVTYDLQVDSSVQATDLLINTAEIGNYASQEGGPNFVNFIPVEPDDAEVEIASLMVFAKTVVSTNQSHTTGLDVAIGERVTYTTTITVPEGVTNDIVFADIPDSGLAIGEVLSIVASPALTSSQGVITSLTPVLGSQGSSLTINFGTIANTDVDNDVPETITITYVAVVVNSSGNNRGTDLDNVASITWDGGTASLSADPVEVVEPTLRVIKTLTPPTGQAGDIFGITLEVRHTGASDAGAFNVSLSDILPSGLTFVSGTLSSSGTAVTTLAELSDTITATWDTFPLGSITTISFQVQAELLAQPGDTITNTANVNWTSLPGDVSAAQYPAITLSNERSGNTAHPGGAVNDYRANGSDTLDLIDATLTKSILSTSLVSTLGNDVAIGEVITYTSVITVPQGTLSNSIWTDTVSSGLAIVDVVSIVANPSGDISPANFAPIIAAATFDANRETVSLNFGTIVNSNLNNATAETITITYRAVVLNSTTNDRGDDLNNTAEFTWGTNYSVDADGPTLEIVEPELDVTKTIAPASGQAADIFTITLVVTHTGLSDSAAFDVTLSDILPDGLTYFGGLSSSGTPPTSLTAISDTITATWAAFPLGSTTTITFQVQTELSVQPGDTITNTAIVDWTSLPGDFPQDVIDALPPDFPDLGERTGDGVGPNDYNADDDATLDLIVLELAKTVQGTDQPQTPGLNVAIGEVITYRSTITVPQGTAPGVVWVDTPVAGLSIIEVVSITTPRPGLSSSLGSFNDILNAQSIAAGGTSATLNFGTLTNSDTNSSLDETIVIEYTAIVLNTLTNDRGDQLGNAARVTYNSFQLEVDGPLVTIVEPELTITKSNNEVAPIDAGDIFTFTIDIAHSGNSDAAAMDVALQDLINSAPNFLGYIPGTLNVSVFGGTVLGSASDTLGDLNVVFDTIPLGGTAQITFDVIIQNTAPPETELVNNATLTWTSIDGPRGTAQSDDPLSVERTGNPADVGGAANDYNASASDSVITAAAEPTKFISSTSQDHTGSSQHSPGIVDLAVGEFVTFDIRVRLSEGTQPLNVIDNLPLAPPLRLVSWSIAFIGGNLRRISDNASITEADFTATPADTNSDGILDEIEWDAAAFLNLPDGVANANDDIEFRVVAELLDTPGATNGAVLTNTATINFGGPISQVVTADVEVVEPIVELVKTVDPTTAPAGSTLTYTIVVAHDAGSTSDAFDLLIEDLLTDPNLVLVPGSVTTTAGTVQVGNGPTDSIIVIAISSLPLGDTITVTFDAIMDSALLLGDQVTNTSTVTYDGLQGPGGREETSSDDAVVTADDPLVDLSVVKSDSPDPVVINDILTYTLIVTNDGPSDATDVILTDVLPAAVTLIDVSPSTGVTVVGQTLTIPIGRLQPGESRVVTIRVTAPSTEQFLINTASVTSPETDANPDNNQTTEETEVLGVSNVSGTVWVDINRDGVIGPTEVRLPGVIITLQGTDVNGNPILLTTTTDANGFYEFTRVPPGEYSLIQTQPTLFVDGNSYVGSEGGTNPSSNQINLTLPPGVDATDYLFSEIGLISGSISKRTLLKSRRVAATGPLGLNFDQFYDLLGRSKTRADLNGDRRVNNDDYILFLSRLGGTFEAPPAKRKRR